VGCPIRRSTDRSSVTSSLWLIAGSNVFHRLSMPSHPPCALIGLTTPTKRRGDRRSKPTIPRRSRSAVHALESMNAPSKILRRKSVVSRRTVHHIQDEHPAADPKNRRPIPAQYATRYSTRPRLQDGNQSQRRRLNKSVEGKAGPKSARRYPVVKEPGVFWDQPGVGRSPLSRLVPRSGLG
jgi:hypothetical protein